MKIIRYGIVILLSVALWGCGKGNSSAPITIDPSTGKHPTGTATAGTGGIHVDSFFSAGAASCEGCHGKLDDLAGGIVKVSCSSVSRNGMSCHAGKFPHGSVFSNPVIHGTNKAITVAGPASGMAFCAKCHGATFKGGPESNGVGCIDCHQGSGSNAPHASKWASYLNNPLKYNHSAAHESNAPVCAQCHANKKYLSPAGVDKVKAFTTKGVSGCYDNTMCHNQARHAIPYDTEATHGVAAFANLGSCQSAACHGNGATPLRMNVQPNGNLKMPNGCETCHVGSLPSPVFGAGTVGLGLAHPPLWLKSRGNITDHFNASFGGPSGSYCNPCHALTGSAAGPSAPSCGTALTIGATGKATRCHSSLANPVLFPVGSCASCHGNPPSSGKHSFHLPPSLPGIGCSACHGSTTGPGQATHANGSTEMGFNNALYGEGTGVTYLGGACSNVSCHGGSDHTVSWLSGTSLGGTDRATCEKCHNQIDLAGSPTQYIDVINGDADPLNSFGNTGWFDSGMNLHALHLSQTTATECITCHDPAKLAARHFINILSGKKSINPGDARDTLIGPSDAPSANPNYGVTSYIYTGGTPKSSCLAASGCHNGNLARTWFQ